MTAPAPIYKEELALDNFTTFLATLLGLAVALVNLDVVATKAFLLWFSWVGSATSTGTGRTLVTPHPATCVFAFLLRTHIGGTAACVALCVVATFISDGRAHQQENCYKAKD